MIVHTVGHSTRPTESFIALLRANGIECLVDVRAIPRSRRNPQYNADQLPQALGAHGIDYRHFAALGGRRAVPGGADEALVGLWREAGFRGYAAYARTPDFRAALDGLIETAAARPCAIMCAEAVWWRCHRRIVADYLLASGVEVRHILSEHRVEPARLTEGARIEPDGRLAYPAPQGRLPV